MEQKLWVILLTPEHVLSHYLSWFVKPRYGFIDISLKAVPFPSLILMKQFHFTVTGKRTRWRVFNRQGHLKSENLRTTATTGYTSSWQSILSPPTGTLGSTNDYKIKYLLRKLSKHNDNIVILIECLPCVRTVLRASNIITNSHKIPKGRYDTQGKVSSSSTKISMYKVLRGGKMEGSRGHQVGTWFQPCL